MAITDINISDTLETSAPSIRYSGNEGPKSPEEQQQMMMAQLEEEYAKYVFEMEEQGLQPMSIQQFMEQAMTEGRQGVAHGGIMGLDGRKRYGIGSWLKKKARKLIPNELATAARFAAPFVAPFNPLIGGAMAGLGGFDKHGSISKGLKSGLMTYGGGQAARWLGGAGPQWGLKADPTSGYFTAPTGSKSGLGKLFNKGEAPKALADYKLGSADALPSKNLGDYGQSLDHMSGAIDKGTSGILDFINKNSTEIILGSMAVAYGVTAKEYKQDEIIELARGKGMDIAGIRAEVQEAFEAGEDAWNELKKKYPYIGQFSTKKAEGGRIGYYSGGQSTPSDYTMEDAMMTTTQDKLGGITDVMKQADLNRQGSVGQYYAADGGRIRYADGRAGYPPVTMGQVPQAPPQMPAPQGPQAPMPAPQPNQMPMMGGMNPMARGMNPMARRMNPMMGGRRMAQEGGLMDLGGMEKDYRDDGGFVPLGEEEKADDVPARLSKNEFVFTADAVRAAGGGDIDKGAGIMERVMENLEQGGQISEESQGLSGAREMFDVSERLSEVV